jgi:hypothetical protein
MVFGPDGTNDGKLDLYVSDTENFTIDRYDGTTGAFKGAFVTSGSGGLDTPAGIAFGSDGNLYVASANWFTHSNGPFYSGNGDFPAGAVLRFEGPAGDNPGAFLGTFVPGGSGGLANPDGMVFGPDPSGNGITDLYVASSVMSERSSTLMAEPGTSEVLRYDGTTGAFLGTFVVPDSGGLKNPTFITFTETDPTTLNYDLPSAPASVSAATATQTAFATNLAPLAFSLLNTGQQGMPARLLAGLAAPTAPQASPSSILPTAGTTAAVPTAAVDAAFAASDAPAPDDATWLLAPLVANSLDAK